MARNRILRRILTNVFLSYHCYRKGLIENTTTYVVMTAHATMESVRQKLKENFIGIREGGVGRAEGSAAAGRLNLVD